MTGTVKWYDEVKGYGFVLTDDGKDIFVHRSGIKDPSRGLETEQTVEFEIKEGQKGPVAVDVAIID